MSEPEQVDNGDNLDDLLDRLVGEYSDLVAGGATPAHAPVLERVPASSAASR